MCRTNEQQNQQQGSSQQEGGAEQGPSPWKVLLFLFVLLADAASTVLLTIPIFSWAKEYETFDSYTLHGSLIDLTILAALRISTCLYSILRNYCSNHVPIESPFELYHPNGDRKTREELESEGLEEPWGPWCRRCLWRSSLAAEIVGLVTRDRKSTRLNSSHVD